MLQFLGLLSLTDIDSILELHSKCVIQTDYFSFLCYLSSTFITVLQIIVVDYIKYTVSPCDD